MGGSLGLHGRGSRETCRQTEAEMLEWEARYFSET